MKALERYWFGDVALARPYLVLRFVLALLAFDMWIDMMPHGAKYGIGAFNVAHFAWFGAFVPSSGFYLGVLAFTGVLALSQALYRPHRIALVLIAAGWHQIHRAAGLVTGGLYRWIRHPQYTGIFLFTFGWILHWPSVITLLLWPILIAAYVWLARFEERQALAEFGEEYERYAARSRRFIPGVL